MLNAPHLSFGNSFQIAHRITHTAKIQIAHNAQPIIGISAPIASRTRGNNAEEDFLAYVTLTMRTLIEASLTAAFMLHKWYLRDEKIPRVFATTSRDTIKRKNARRKSITLALHRGITITKDNHSKRI